MTCDRLIYIERLRSSGVDEQVARPRSYALQDALHESVATKADVIDAVREPRAELDVRFGTLASRCEAVDARFDGLRAGWRVASC